MRKINVIFPIAGDGLRFGGNTFKPFLDATEKKFIELAKEPFDLLESDFIVTYYFIYREDQEDKFQVKDTLIKLFPNNILKFILINTKTMGPLQTLQRGLEVEDIIGPTFVCDCDQIVRIKPFIPYLHSELLVDIIIPVWEIQENEQISWAKLKVSSNNKILSYHEKEQIPFVSLYKVKGIIGCYLFKDINVVKHFANHCGNMTEFLCATSQLGLKSDILDIEEGEFFGTPEQLIEFRFKRAKKYTFLIDIDGTIIHLPKHVPYEASDSQLLPGSVEKIREWKHQGHRIILITGRETSRREKLIKQLADLNIPYDELITGTNSGTRIVINDKKPYCPFHKMAIAIQLPRNKGMEGVDIEDTPNLIKNLKGGSFASVYLIKINKKYMVRKYIEKTKENEVHYQTLRRQLDDLKRFDYYSPNCVPKIFNVYESPDEFYFDMEYLEHYEELIKYPFSIIKSNLPRIIAKLKKDIYCYKKEINGKVWLKDFLQEKIYTKYEFIENIDGIFYRLINNDYLIINNTKIKGLRYYFKTEDIKYYPIHVSPIHGDLTLENILYNSMDDDFKFIDQSGARYVDPYEFDVAKLLQSLLAKYGEWDKLNMLCICNNDSSFTVNEKLIDMDKSNYEFMLSEFDANTTIVYKKGVFFLSMYLIRMIPFLLKKSKETAYLGMLLSLYYLHSV